MPALINNNINLMALIALLIQIAGFIWFASAIVADVRHNTQDINEHTIQINTLEDSVHQQALSSVAIERSVENIEALVERALRDGN